MRVIERKIYLEKLKKFKDKQLIKVRTGIRRCGKSTLLELFQEYLKQNGVDKKQIITINFENPDYKQLKTSEALYDYIKNKLTKGKMNYIFLDEIQNVEKFEVAVDGLFINKNVDNKAMLINDDENICIMINDVEHLKIEVLACGLELENALNLGMEIEEVSVDKTLLNAVASVYVVISGIHLTLIFAKAPLRCFATIISLMFGPSSFSTSPYLSGE